METKIKDLKTFPLKMLSAVCVGIPVILTMIVPGYECDMIAFATFALLAESEMILMPSDAGSLRLFVAPLTLFLIILIFALIQIPIIWSLMIIVVFPLCSSLSSKAETSAGSVKSFVYELLFVLLMSISSLMILSGERVLQSAALFMSAAIYTMMALMFLLHTELPLPGFRRLQVLCELAEKELLVRTSRVIESADDIEEMKRLMDRVESVMQKDKPYLSETYCLMDLAAAVYTNKTYLSRTINHMSGKNFRQYINTYRVEYALQLMRQDNKLRVAELSVLSGFHSAVTFGMAFKFNYGETPGEYLQKLKAGLE